MGVIVYVTWVVVGDMLGLGSLTLPSVFARLGWIPALIVIVICGVGTMYSGRLFALLATKVRRLQRQCSGLRQAFDLSPCKGWCCLLCEGAVVCHAIRRVSSFRITVALQRQVPAKVLRGIPVQVPRAKVFDDFGGAAMGSWGRRFTYVTVYATILAEPIIFHLTSMEALQQIFYGSGITPIFAAIIVALVMIPLSQVWQGPPLHRSPYRLCPAAPRSL